jgi:hypothetical protein
MCRKKKRFFLAINEFRIMSVSGVIFHSLSFFLYLPVCHYSLSTINFQVAFNSKNPFLRGCTLFGCLPRLFPRW